MESFISRLKERGLKITPQRRAILGVLIERRSDHPGARLVHREASKKKPGLSLSTVYATLNELSALGLIKTLQFEAMENRYEGNLEEHVNLICGRCRKILDYRAPRTIDQRKVAKQTGFSITDSRVEYYGLCKECRAAARRADAASSIIKGGSDER
jgi:Fur family transcriptional regulator, peroxide stress response regulator